MKVEYQILEDEYIKLKFFLYYRKPVAIITVILFVYLMYSVIRDFFAYGFLSQFDFFFIIMGIYFLIVFPIIFYFRIRKEYRTSKPLQKKVVSEITEERIIDVTEDSTAEASWNDVYKIEELKSWFILYYSKQMFGVCPKKAMTQEQIAEFRRIVNSKNIKAKLKTD